MTTRLFIAFTLNILGCCFLADDLWRGVIAFLFIWAANELGKDE